MRLWSIQTPKAYQTLQERGVLRGDGRKVAPYFRPAYAWMQDQMRARVPSYTKGTLVWAWAKKPDLRVSGREYPDEKNVRLEIEVDPSRVLLSDFDAWHFVLNNAYLHSRSFDERETVTKEQSWERIFDLDAMRALFNTDGCGLEQVVQAVLAEIRIEDVRQVKEYTSR